MNDIPPTGRDGDRLKVSISADGETVFGHIYDPEDEQICFAVELWLDGWRAKLAWADLYDDRLARSGLANPFHAFVFHLPIDADRAERLAEVKLANSDHVIGVAELRRQENAEFAKLQGPGEIIWEGGLRFSGWLSHSHAAPRIRALIEEVIVAEVEASSWTAFTMGPLEVTALKFDFHLPTEFADGKLRLLEVVDLDGQTLKGSPVPFVAFSDSLERLISERAETSKDALRGELADNLTPQSIPFSWLEEWRKRFPLPPPPEAAEPVAIVLIGDVAIERTIESLEKCHLEWTAAALSSPENDGRFDREQLKEFLAGEGLHCAYVLCAPSGTVFEAGSVQRLIAPLNDHDEIAVSYGDIIAIEPDGRRYPLALPAFDYERLLEQSYCAFLFALRREGVLSAIEGGVDNVFRLLNFFADDYSSKPGAFVHVPGFLADAPVFDASKATAVLAEATENHLGARGIEAQIDRIAKGFYFPTIRVRRRDEDRTLSVVVAMPPGRLSAHIKETIRAIRAQRTRRELHLIVVATSGSVLTEAEYLNEIDGVIAEVVRAPEVQSLAAAFNIGAARSKTDRLLFVDANFGLRDPETIDELMSRCAEADVGGVGLLVAWPNGVIRDAGGVLNFHSGVAPSFGGAGPETPGYADMLLTSRQCSALVSGLLLTRRDHYDDIGGLDQRRYPFYFFMADYCLRQRERSRRIVVSPHARVVLLGADPIAVGESEHAKAAFSCELTAFRQRWGEALASDPFYSPLLSLNGDRFSALAWPPRGLEPRWSSK